MRILLAEDEEMLSNILVTVLEKNHYSVDVVSNGFDALDHLENEGYDCVILDIVMPKLDGITVLRTLRAMGNDVPVLILTAKAEIGDRARSLNSGADDYLAKPFATKELLERLRTLTGGKAHLPKRRFP